MTDFGPKRFRLLFRGQLAPSVPQDDAGDALTSELSLTPEQVKACFSGRKVSLRSNLDEASARALAQRLGAAGLLVEVDPPLPPANQKPQASEETPRQANAAKAAAPQPSAVADTPSLCPRCQASSPTGGLCRACLGARRATTLRWLAALVVVGAVAGAGSWAWLTHLQPMWHEHQSQQHLAHAVARVEEAEQAIVALYEKTGFLPNTNLDAGLPAEQQFADDTVAGIRVGSSAQITVTLQPDLPLIGGDTIIFIAERHDREVLRWRCEAGTLEAARRPESCQHKLVIATSKPAPAKPISLEDITSKLPSGDPLARRKAVALDEISDILSDSKSLRLKVMTYYATNAEWPAGNKYLGLPDPNRLGGGNIQYVKVLGDGRIEYRFNGRTSGLDGHRFWLKPGGMGQWRCATTLPDDHLPPACDNPVL